MELAPGKRLSFYEILGPLGAGGMAEVYRALDTRLEREVALKVLPEHLADDEVALTRFEREARTLASLTHPNIGAIHGVDQVEDICFLVLELVPGEDLARRFERGALPVAEVLEIGRQVAEGLAVAHKAGVVHRDLKPANVVVTPDGRAKILDFGLAKKLTYESSATSESDESTLTGEGTILGTADYMSPEQSRGREVDERTDRWAFGCLLFELLSGERIFPADSVPDKLAAIHADEPRWDALPSTTPPAVRALIERCLEKDAESRTIDLEEAARILAGTAAAPPKAPTLSIAVLPFANSGSKAEDEYFSDGIADEVRNALGLLPGLRVAARTSSFAFKDRSADTIEIGAKLGVSRVLEGSVRRAGERLRITVQLIDAKNGYQLWSERFDRETGDIFDVQDEVAAAVAAALREELGATEAPTLAPRRTSNLEAYDRYLQGQFHLRQRGSALEQAVLAFRGALELDPDLADAHAGLAMAYSLLSYYGSRRPHKMMPCARAAAERALAINPKLAAAHTALAWVHMIYDWDDACAQSEFQAALRFEPDAVQPRLWYGAYILSLFQGRTTEGLAMCREAVELDPLSGSAHCQLGVALNFAGCPEEALATLGAQLDDHPTSYLLWFHHALSRFNLGDIEGARTDLEHAVHLSSMNAWAMGLLGATHARLGDQDRALAIQGELEREDFIAPFCLAMTPATLGRSDEALAHLENGIGERDGLMRVLPAFRVFDDLRSTPRYAAVARQAKTR